MSLIEVFLPVDNIILYIIISAVFEALAVYLLQFRKLPGALLLVFCQVSKGIWVLSKVFLSISPELAAKLFWIKVSEWMPLLLIFFWFEFILETSRQNSKILKAVQYLVRVIVFFLVLIIGADDWLGWYWGPMSIDGQAIKLAFGPAARVTMFFCYFLNVICLALSIRWVYSTNGLRRKQAIVIAVTPIFNFMGSVFGYIVQFQAMPPQVLGWLASAFYVTWVFYRWRIYSILPLAQDSVVRNMNDGLIITDKKGYIVDMNPAAKEIFNFKVSIDDKFEQAVAIWPALAAVRDDYTVEAASPIAENCFYQIRTLLLKTPQGNLLGKTIIFKDITEQKRNQARLVDQEKALSIMKERERLGRELHDGNGQLWSYITMQLEAVRTLFEKKDFAEADLLLAKVVGVTQDIHIDLRESITGLQLSADREGVWQTLEDYLVWFEENYEIKAQLEIDKNFEESLLSPTTKVQLLRIIQEALTNIRKSAKASYVKVLVTVNGGLAAISVEDDGCGFDLGAGAKKKGSFGLKIMQERALEIGAQFYIESKPGNGTKVILEVPLLESQ